MNRAHPIADRVVCLLGVLMVVVYAVVMYRHAILDPHSMWCDPHLVGCVIGHRR